MFERLWRYWRVLATGLCFSVFGIGGLVLRVLVFPLLYLLFWQPKARVNAARAVVRHTFLWFIGLMRLCGVLRYEVIGREKLARGGLLILANHPTLIDTVFLMAFVRRADCIVKHHLWHNPFTRGPVRAAGYIHNEQGDELVADCIASLQAGNNLIIFPEGTRTPAGAPVSLKRGAANIAVRGSRNVTPVLIQCQPPTLGKGEKWWQVPLRQASFRIEVKDDIAIQPFIEEGQSGVMAARHLTEYLQNYFNNEGATHA